MYKRTLFLALISGCQLLAGCEPQTMTKTTSDGSGSMSSLTVSFDSPKSVFDELESAGFSRVSPGQQPFGLSTLQKLGGQSSTSDSPLRQMKHSPGLTPLAGGGSMSGFESPRKLAWQPSNLFGKSGSGRLGSSLNFNPYDTNVMGDWEKVKDDFEAIKTLMFDNIDSWGQGLRGMHVGSIQFGGIKSSVNEGNLPWNNIGSWGHPGGEDARVQNSGRPGEKTRRGNGSGAGFGAASADFAQQCLDAHNKYRTKHGVPPLRLNSQLSKISQNWAEHLANDVHKIKHRKKSGHGENIWNKWSSDKGLSVSCQLPVDRWYSERNQYKDGSSNGGGATGHYTQVVWKDSTELGVGIAKGPDNNIFVVCNYDPPGNVRNQYAENVPPLGGSAQSNQKSQANNDNQADSKAGGPAQRLGSLQSSPTQSDTSQMLGTSQSSQKQADTTSMLGTPQSSQKQADSTQPLGGPQSSQKQADATQTLGNPQSSQKQTDNNQGNSLSDTTQMLGDSLSSMFSF